MFPHAVLYQQPLSAAAVVAQGAPKKEVVASGAAAAGALTNDIVRIHDPEVRGREARARQGACSSSLFAVVSRILWLACRTACYGAILVAMCRADIVIEPTAYAQASVGIRNWGAWL